MEKGRIILIGIGNDLLTDDGIGPYMVKRIGRELDFEHAAVTHLSLELLDLVLGRRLIYIIDSFKDPELPVGEVKPFSLEDLEYLQNPSYSHGITIPIIFSIGEKLYRSMPENVRIFGINVSDNQTISDSFSDILNHKLDEISHHLCKRIKIDAGGKI
jgi:hydrogenase maturation protease